MLAITPKTMVYLSAAELGISDRERAGLIEVRDDLASGRVKHAPVLELSTAEYEGEPDACFFNMGEWDGTSECGTAHCIGGFMRARGCFKYTEYSDSLQSLFYPTKGYLFDLTVDQAVRAIDHFLSGAGDECWPLALSDEPA